MQFRRISGSLVVICTLNRYITEGSEIPSFLKKILSCFNFVRPERSFLENFVSNSSQMINKNAENQNKNGVVLKK